MSPLLNELWTNLECATNTSTIILTSPSFLPVLQDLTTSTRSTVSP